MNEGGALAESTLTAVMARESAYTRKQFKRSWFESKCTLDLLPPGNLTLTAKRPPEAVPSPDRYELPVRG